VAQFDRFDICEAHAVLEWDYNEGGWLKERPSNRRRMKATSVQLHRMQFSPSMALSFENLTENGQEIYLDNVLKLKLPMDEAMAARLNELFVPEYLHKMRPDIWAKSQVS
jgi:hypothetical protein